MEMGTWPAVEDTAPGTHEAAKEHDYFPISLESPSLSFAFLLKFLHV